MNHYPYKECLYAPEAIEQEVFQLETYGIHDYEKPNFDDFYQLENIGEHIEDL